MNSSIIFVDYNTQGELIAWQDLRLQMNQEQKLDEQAILEKKSFQISS
jgi:hypothetical protein